MLSQFLSVELALLILHRLARFFATISYLFLVVLFIVYNDATLAVHW